jgi:hypothetical protein
MGNRSSERCPILTAVVVSKIATPSRPPLSSSIFPILPSNEDLSQAATAADLPLIAIPTKDENADDSQSRLVITRLISPRRFGLI